MTPAILSIQVGQPEEAARRTSASGEQLWTTGFGKRPVTEMARLRTLNFDGDGQADQKHHGGPDKAVCVYPASHYPYWRNALGKSFNAGAFAENLTVDELTEESVCIGDVWQIGGAHAQVSQPRQPCWRLSRWWGIEDLAVRVQRTGRTGWYLRVLQEEDVQAGAPIRLVERLHSDWTIAAANELTHRDKRNLAAANALANLPELSASWRATLSNRNPGVR